MQSYVMIKSLGNTGWHCYSPVESLLCHRFHFITFGSNVLPTVKLHVASLRVLRFSVDFNVLYVFATWDNGLCIGFPLLPASVFMFLVSIWNFGSALSGCDEALQIESCQGWVDCRPEPGSSRLFSLHLEESNIFIGVFSRNASACFELRAFYILHYISAMQNIGYFPLGKCSSSSVLMSSVLTSRLLSVLYRSQVAFFIILLILCLLLLNGTLKCTGV